MRERPLGVGHQRRALGHLVADVPQLLDVRLIGLAEIEPDAGIARHHVGLIAAVGDHLVRALRQPQVLATVVPAHAHQLHGVERRASAPRRTGAVRRLALEGVLHRHEPVAAGVAPRDIQVVADVREQVHVHVLEHPIANEPRLRRHQFLGHTRPEHQRARQLVALHDLLHRNRRDDVERHAGVVAFAVARRAFDDRIVIRHAGLLRRLRNAVDVGAQRDHGLARSPCGHPRRGNARLAARDREAVLFEDTGQVLRRFNLLEAPARRS